MQTPSPNSLESVCHQKIQGVSKSESKVNCSNISYYPVEKLYTYYCCGTAVPPKMMYRTHMHISYIRFWVVILGFHAKLSIRRVGVKFHVKLLFCQLHRNWIWKFESIFCDATLFESEKNLCFAFVKISSYRHDYSLNYERHFCALLQLEFTTQKWTHTRKT